MKKATVTMMEWTHAPVGFKLEREGDPELDEDMSNCKWRKCGDVTCEAALNCSEVGAEVSLACGDYTTRKYRLVQVRDCGRYKVFTHKHKAALDVVLRVIPTNTLRLVSYPLPLFVALGRTAEKIFLTF